MDPIVRSLRGTGFALVFKRSEFLLFVVATDLVHLRDVRALLWGSSMGGMLALWMNRIG